jgi:hypothetical protein
MKWGKAEVDKGVCDQPFPTCRRIGEGMQTKGSRRNTGNLSVHGISLSSQGSEEIYFRLRTRAFWIACSASIAVWCA